MLKMTPLSKKKLLEYLKARLREQKPLEHQKERVIDNCLIMISPDMDPTDKFYKNYNASRIVLIILYIIIKGDIKWWNSRL